MTDKDFITLLSEYNLMQQGEVATQSPSNIALVKYWGKKEPQLPTNPSISYTLSNCYTETTVKFSPKQAEQPEIKVYLDEKETPSFLPKIQKFFGSIQPYVPILSEFDFTIHTQNSFPHSSGIASSASGMSALANCLVQMETQFGKNYSEKEKLQKTSFLARLGSGSACRSVYEGLVVWGESGDIENSSDLYAVPYPYEVAPVFKTFQDTILLIHEGQKSVSSSVGHNLMHDHPYAQQRFVEANKNLVKLKPILKNGDLAAFGRLIEHEALSLHAMMLTSNPAFILMKPNTLIAIERIWAFRKESNAHIYFTLDAGANIHILYPQVESDKIKPWIEQNLQSLCQNQSAIFDDLSF